MTLQRLAVLCAGDVGCVQRYLMTGGGVAYAGADGKTLLHHVRYVTLPTVACMQRGTRRHVLYCMTVQFQTVPLHGITFVRKCEIILKIETAIL